MCNDCNRLKSSLMSHCADCNSYRLDEWNVIFEHICLELKMINNNLKKEKIKIDRDNYQWMLSFKGISIKIKACIFCQRVLKHQLGVLEEGVILEEEIHIRKYLSIIKKSI